MISHRPSSPASISSENATASRLTLAIVDDHPPICQALREAADERIGMHVVGEAGSSEAARPLIKTHNPDVAVVDLSLSDGQSFGLMQTLGAECPGTGLLVFSMYDERVYAERALRSGASGYLMKPASTAEVLQAAETVADGGLHLSAQMAPLVVQETHNTDVEQIRFPIDELTDRQLEVFRLMGQGLTAEKIADRLGLGQKTVEAHRRKAKEKLGYETLHEVVSHAARWVQAEPGRGAA